MTLPVPGPPPLRASVVIDYQNVHLVGHEAFPTYCSKDRHESLVDPLKFAVELLKVRNAAQLPGHRAAALRDVWVYRGLPSSDHDPEDYARSQAQKAHWERDSRVHVELRPLRYTVERDAYGRPVRDVHGKAIVLGKREKGVDVLCALAMVREATRPDVDLVVIASHDSDLEPAKDATAALGSVKVETFRWDSPDSYVYQLRPAGRRAWCTRASTSMPSRQVETSHHIDGGKAHLASSRIRSRYGRVTVSQSCSCQTPNAIAGR